LASDQNVVGADGGSIGSERGADFAASFNLYRLATPAFIARFIFCIFLIRLIHAE